MKKILISFPIALLFALLVTSFISEENASGSKVHWMSIEEAVAAAAKSPRPIMVDLYTQWCGPCKMLSKNTFEDDRVAEYLNANYYCVKFDAEGRDSVVYNGNTFKNPDYKPDTPGRNATHQFTQYLRVSAYPTLFFMDKKAQPLGPVTGYRTPAQIELFLKFFAEEKHLTIVTSEQWTEYEKNFVPTWN